MRPLLCALIILTSGCTHIQLRNSALNQAQAALQLQQQQVLNNLAMFMGNPNAVPYFTIVSTGLTQVNDTGSVSATPAWSKLGFSSVGAAFSGSRINQENFSSIPVSDPFRLTWMRCAYQTAVGFPVDGAQSAECCAILRSWNKTSTTGCPGVMSACQCLPDQSCAECCLPGPGWFGVGKKCDVPKCALYVGRHGKVYVWVLPEGTEEFAQLTFAIVGFAATKRQVTWDKSWSCKDSMCHQGPTNEAPTVPGESGATGTHQPSGQSENPLVPIPPPISLPQSSSLHPFQGGGRLVTFPPIDTADVSDAASFSVRYHASYAGEDTAVTEKIAALQKQLKDLQDKVDKLKPLSPMPGVADTTLPTCKVTETTVIGDAGVSSSQGAKPSTPNAAPPVLNPELFPAATFSVP